MLKRRAERGEQEGGLRGLSGLSQREALVLFSFPLHCSHHPPRISPPLRSGGGRGRGQASALTTTGSLVTRRYLPHLRQQRIHHRLALPQIRAAEQIQMIEHVVKIVQLTPHCIAH